jgi:hypothetical protein
MQITNPRGNFIEKVLRDRNGRLVRATFCVYECNGRAKAHLLSAILIPELGAIEGKTFAIGGTVAYKIPLVSSTSAYFVVSPYFSSELLYSIGSKPRAPTF